jgi:hypothetical protein
MDTLLKAKILDKDISVYDLAECDKQAIYVFLRNTAFGPEYKFTLKDPETGNDFEHIVDLSVLSTKEVDTTPNSDGTFDFTLPKSGKQSKLRLLTPEDARNFKKLEESYKSMKVKPMATKKLERCVVELDGEKDPMTIALEIHKLPLIDAQEIRKFLSIVEPGLNLDRIAKSPSGKDVNFTINFGLNFFRPFFGL